METNGIDLPKALIKNIKKAEPLKLSDAAMQFSKLTEENASLKQGYDELKRQIELITAAFAAKQKV